MRVLHIEDEEYQTYLVREMCGIQVELEHASSLAEAQIFIASSQFDVLLVDLNLPDSFGLNTLKALLRCHIPIVILAGETCEKFVSQAVQMGAAAYITKDALSTVDLIDKLKSACQNQLRYRCQISFGDIEQLKRYLCFPVLHC